MTRFLACTILVIFATFVSVNALYTEADYSNGLVKIEEDNVKGIFVGIPEKPGAMLVEFYAPWCKYCKELSRGMVQLAKNMGEMDPPVKVGVVNCEENELLCKVYDVKSFPTIKLITRDWTESRELGKNVRKQSSIPYDGEVHYLAIQDFIVEELDVSRPIQFVESLSEVENFVATKGSSLLIYLANMDEVTEDDKAKVQAKSNEEQTVDIRTENYDATKADIINDLRRAADRLHENRVSFVVTQNRDVATSLGIKVYKGKSGYGAAVLLRPSMNEPFEKIHFDGDIENMDALDIFVLKNQFPRVVFFSDDVVKRELFKYSYLNVFIFVEPGYKHLSLLLDALQSSVSLYDEKVPNGPTSKPHFIISYRMNFHRKLLFKYNVNVQQQITHPIFGISHRLDDDDDTIEKFSRIIEINEHIDANDLAEQQIVPFLSECLEGKCEKVLSSLPVPTAKQQELSQVTIAVGTTYEEIVLKGSQDKNIIVAFYSPTCRGSKWMMPHFEEASTKFEEKSNELEFVKLDVVSNEVLHPSATCKTVPMIKLFLKGQDPGAPILFVGEPNFDALTEFIVKHVGITQDDEL